jgi:hypothetical protein
VTNSSNSAAQFEIHSEERGPHWIAWLARDSAGKPVNAVVLVGETRTEAETRAREYAAQLAARGEA